MFFPLLLNLKNKNLLVIGGGKVALRKTRKLKKYCKNITVYSKKFLSDFLDIKGINIIEKEFNDFFDLDNFNLVFAATDNEKLNLKIENYCKENKILCNNITNQDSDIILPATVKYSGLQISVSTSGKGAFLAKKIKEDIKSKYSEEYISLLFEIRDKLIKNNQKGKLKEILKKDYKELIDIYEEINSRN
ncbi:MAG: precorrin-2 dehydrogenase/sirohydrochlorin ferrochelatase family protein [Bacillota bacterium]